LRGACVPQHLGGPQQEARPITTSTWCYKWSTFKGEHMQPAYAAINPNCLVPVLEDGDFRLTECSASLKYLADKVDSPAYPKQLQQRARVNERMDWFNTQFYRDFGYGLIYPQLFPNLKRPTDEQQRGVVAWGKEKSKAWLKVLDENLIGPRNDYVCGSQITLADYLGAAYITAGDVVRCNLSAYPYVTRWIGNMRRRKNWEKGDALPGGLAAERLADLLQR